MTDRIKEYIDNQMDFDIEIELDLFGFMRPLTWLDWVKKKVNEILGG